MAAPLTSSLFATLVLLLTLSVCQAVELEEIRPWRSRHVKARGLEKRDLSVFELKSIETFLWGAEDGSEVLLGNLTVLMPDDNQNVLSMENFDGMLTSVDCGAQGLTLGFEDDTSFAYAQRVWDWVNGAENHTFLMVVGKGDCGSNKNRLPYLVSSIAYDEERNIASLTATEGSWKDLAHSYELRVGRVPMSTDLGLQRRDWTKDASMGLSADLGFKTKVQTGPVSGELQCNPCYTTGNINFEFVIKTSYQIPVGLRIRMAPQGVKLGATLRLNVASHFNTKQGLPERSLLKIPLSGISIPGGILTIGPVLDLQLGGEVKFEGVISITSGATATIPDTAVLQADLLDPSNNEFSSWVPSIVKEDTKVQGKVAAVLKLWLEPALKLQAEALGQGLEAGLEFRMPYIESKLEAIAAADGGACKPNDPYELGVKVSTTYGVEVKFKAGSIKGKQAVDVTIGSASLPFGPPACWGWEEPTLGSPSSLPSNPTSNTPRPTSPGSSGGGNSCTVTPTGRSGTCLATGACADSGRESTPGYCPNDPPGIQVSSSFTSEYNLQLLTGTKCCTSAQPESSSSSDVCTVGTTGPKGECISTSSCSSLGGSSTPGYCPGSTNIQCCTYDRCTVGGKAGDCIPTSACTGTSTPGYCKGGSNIQCCT